MSPANRVVDAVLDAGEPVLFLSAHLDDAVLSCGALMTVLAGRCPLTVATVFTESCPPPHSRAARSFLRQCGARDAEFLFAGRRAEDREVVGGLGAEPVHLGATDALFRRRRVPAVLARVLPELVHRYPTYRFDIARGRVSRGDRALVGELRGRVERLRADTGAALVFAPVGIGRHVDHLLTREIATGLRGPVVLYSDFPYDLTGAADPAAVAGRPRWTGPGDPAAKDPLIRGYRTQADALFPDGRIPARPETYWGPPDTP
jgi:LmbE family N-acetylglucosaminyl deacetylase